MNAPNLITLAPYLQQISFGLLAGFAAGYALKKVGKLLAVALGLLFIALQVLAYYGFVTVNWRRCKSGWTRFWEKIRSARSGKAS